MIKSEERKGGTSRRFPWPEKMAKGRKGPENDERKEAFPEEGLRRKQKLDPQNTREKGGISGKPLIRQYRQKDGFLWRQQGEETFLARRMSFQKGRQKKIGEKEMKNISCQKK